MSDTGICEGLYASCFLRFFKTSEPATFSIPPPEQAVSSLQLLLLNGRSLIAFFYSTTAVSSLPCNQSHLYSLIALFSANAMKGFSFFYRYRRRRPFV
ncbi:hypothetical protein L1987_29802 [Smallanthus sonchifolius]|uniref:Uncharacterized protein n=1 Tax=Smallanthus sonchifolius TaxID=185202 RepID=A0ACB9I104_9ASTR|nr:hypothetical protein L1987_29802 [Smallanthus sonchifolius]